MEKTKLLWKRKSSERSSFDSRSSVSSSVHSDKDCNDQDDGMKETTKDLLEKLSAALVNVSAKEELVKQHSKVAEEAIAGWEAAETQVSNLKLQLDAAMQQNMNLEAALKGCVAQLRQAKANACSDPNACLLLEKENSFLKEELVSRFKELEVVIYERDLSIQTAEIARKLQLEAIKKVAKLEAELRRAQLLTRKLSPSNNKRSVTATYVYAGSFTDSHSDCGEGTSTVDIETLVTSNMELNALESNSAGMWASALIAQLDHVKGEKPTSESLRAVPVGISIMDDFLEMERLAGLPDTKSNTPNLSPSGSPCGQSVDNPLMADCDAAFRRVAEMEKKLENVEMERTQLETALFESQVSLDEARSKLKELQNAVSMESQPQVLDTEHGARTILGDVKKIENGKEQKASITMVVQEMDENEPRVARKVEESMIQEKENSFDEQKDLTAADKLAECQKAIASLGKQLSSLATLEDFLVDTSNIPGFSRSQVILNTSIASAESGNLENSYESASTC